MEETDRDIDVLALALYNLSALRRELQRLAGIEHAVAPLTALSVVNRIGPARISDVAAELEVNLSVASRRIQRLEDEGFVDRVADPDDGRCSLIAISAAGIAKLQAAHDRIVQALASAVRDWNPAEVAGLADGLVRLRAALGSHHPHEPALQGAMAAAARSASLQPAGVHHRDFRQEEHSR